MRQLVDAETAERTLDGYLRAFWGYHKKPTERRYLQRPFTKVPLHAVSSRQVVSMPHEEMVACLTFAMDIEDPILLYSRESGNGFDRLLPNLARFMGRDRAAEAYAEGEGSSRQCEGPWCREERRHGHLLARLVERLTGRYPHRRAQQSATTTTSDVTGALRHLNHRMGTEWGAASAYLMLAGHSDGTLREALLNILRDELKHLTIVSAADVYLHGHRPWSRTLRMLEKTWIEVKATFTKVTKQGAPSVQNNLFNLLSMAAAHFLIERRMRGYLRSLPLMTLREVFEAESTLPPLPTTLTAAELEVRALAIAEEQRHRRRLLRWPLGQRRAAIARSQIAEELEPLATTVKHILVVEDDVTLTPEPAPREAMVDTVEFVRELSGRAEDHALGAAIRDHFRHQRIMSA